MAEGCSASVDTAHRTDSKLVLAPLGYTPAFQSSCSSISFVKVSYTWEKVELEIYKVFNIPDLG